MTITVEGVKARYPEAKTVGFGDSRGLSGLLISLIREGKKQATCGALRDFVEGRDPMPNVGQRDIVIDWHGVPVLVIETSEVTIRRFCDVDSDFALAEGENETLEGWQKDHRDFFIRNGGWKPDMELVCERFRLIEDLTAPGSVEGE